MTEAGSASPCNPLTQSSSRSDPPACDPTPCQPGKNRARTPDGTGSASRRSAASDRRRSVRSTSGWQYSRSETPCLKAPATRSPLTARRRRTCSTSLGGRPQRAATSTARNGTCVLAQRLRSPSMGSGAGLGEGLGGAGGGEAAEGVAGAAGLPGRDPARGPRDPDRAGPPLGDKGLQPVSGDAASGELVAVQITKAGQKVVRLVGVAWPAFRLQTLQLELQIGNSGRVEQLSQLL